MRHATFLLVVIAFGAAAAHAATSSSPSPGAKLAPDPKCVIDMDAEKLDASVISGKGGVATGNVVVTQCDMKMRADTVRVTMVNNQYDKLIATGNVVLISQKSGVLTGDNGVYEVPKRFVTMTGHVVLKDGKNVASGTRGTYNLATGIAMLDASPAAPGFSNGKVHVILTPQPDAGTKTAPPDSGAK